MKEIPNKRDKTTIHICFDPPKPAARDGRSWPVDKLIAAFSSTATRNAPRMPRSVMYAAMPAKMNTTTDLRLPPPMRISVFEPQPEPSVMPTPNRNPPTTYESHVKFGPG